MADYNKENDKVVEFPSWETVPESTKQTPGYCIDVARAIYNKYTSDKTAIGHSWGSFFDMLRSYGAGKQDTTQYKNFLYNASASTSTDTGSGEDTKVVARKGWHQVDWDSVISFIPNLRSQIFGAFNDLDFDIKCNSVDLDSGVSEEMKMLDLAVSTHPVLGKILNDLKQTANIPVEEVPFVPEDMNELEQLKDEGYFKESYIKQHEKLIQYTEQRSDWDRFIKQELLADVIDIGHVFAMTEFSDETCIPVWKYVDPAKVIMQWSSNNGYADSDYAGVKESMSVSQLKQYRDFIVNRSGEKITEEQFKQLAKQFCGKEGNPNDKEWDKYDKSTTNGYLYDSFKIEVVKTFWIDTEYISRIKYSNKYGKTRVYDYQEPEEGDVSVRPGDNSFNFKKPFGNNYSLTVEPIDGTKIAKQTKRADGFNVSANNHGRIKYKAYYNIGKDEKLNKTRLRKVYYCYWLKDTDYCFKYGPMPNQPRTSYAEPLLPIVGYRYPHKAITYRCVPVENMYQIAWLRLQNSVAKASQGGYAINSTLLGDQGKKLDPLKVLKAWRENQVLFYKMGVNGNVGGTPVPISYIPGNLGEAIANEVQILNFCIKWQEDQTGFSGLALGQVASPDQPVGTAQQSLQSTQKSILPILTAMRYIKEELAKRTSVMWQLALKEDPKVRQEAAKVIGEDGVQIVTAALSLGNQYGIDMVARPDAEIKQAIMQSATVSFQNKEITSDERLFIIEQLTSGENPREIRMRLRKMIQKNKKAEHEMGLQNIKAQGEENARLAQVQAQSAEAIKMAELKAADGMARIKAQADIITRNHDSWCKINEIIAQAKVQAGQPVANPLPQEPQPQQAPQQMPPQQIPMQNGS